MWMHENGKEVFMFVCVLLTTQGSHLNLGQEIHACSFMFKATRLLHFNPQVFHIGENHILHCCAATKHNTLSKKTLFLSLCPNLQGSTAKFIKHQSNNSNASTTKATTTTTSIATTVTIIDNNTSAIQVYDSKYILWPWQIPDWLALVKIILQEKHVLF